MKAQVINTDFSHDGKYYVQNSITDLPPDLIKKYPSNLLAVIEPINESINQEINIDENISSKMIQDNSTADNMPAPSAKIIKPSRQVGTKKNKRGK
ncbi:MAG: hypothetical protein WC879_13080 [Melioribacteraceae bacterium]